MTDSKKTEHFKPYDYKIGGVDNDGVIVEKIYAKALDYVIYRTKTAIRIDMDDESDIKIWTAIYLNNCHR